MSLIEIAQKLEAAIRNAQAKKVAFDTALKAIGDTEAAYKAAQAEIQQLHKDYSDLVSSVVVGFAGVHK